VVALLLMVVTVVALLKVGKLRVTWNTKREVP
jgi:hypothetical protein